MPFDFKKEYREFYLPPSSPTIVTVPEMSFITVTGYGDPNQPGGLYQQTVGQLYGVAYTLKMGPRSGYAIAGFSTMSFPRWRAGGDRRGLMASL